MASIPPPIDPVFLTKKQQVINIVKAKNCTEAQFIQDNANTREELVEMLFEFSKTFDCDPKYLEDLLAPFTDAELTAYGIYYNKTGITITNPKVLIKCLNCIVNINAGGSIKEINICDQSTITSINIQNNTILGLLNIGGGSIVDVLSIMPGSCIDVLLIKACNSFNSELKKVTDNSCIKNISIDDDAVYGGYECVINTSSV